MKNVGGRERTTRAIFGTAVVVFDFFADVFFTGEGDLEREAEAAACCDRFVPLGLEAVKSAIFEYSK